VLVSYHGTEVSEVDLESPYPPRRPNLRPPTRSRGAYPPCHPNMLLSRQSRTGGLSSCPPEKRLSDFPRRSGTIEGIVELVLELLMGTLQYMGVADGRYGGIRSKHPTLAARAAMEAARRVSAIHPEDEEEYDEEQEDEQRPNFAERFLLGMSQSPRDSNADIKPTRRIHSTLTTFGYQPQLLRTLLSSKTRMKKWKIPPQAMGLRTTKPLNLHLGSILSLPTLQVYAASINNGSLVAIHYGSPVVDSPVRDDSVQLLETFLPSFPILVYIPLRVFNWQKMRVIHSLVHLNLRGGHLLLVDLVSLRKEGLMSDHPWLALLMEWELVRSLLPLGSLYL
jgi:hypothetical protein